MGRRRTTGLDLPPRMFLRHGAYYYVARGVWKRLDADKATALRMWAELEGAPAPAVTNTLSAVWQTYQVKVLPLKAQRTQHDNKQEAERLLAVFGHMQIEHITPQHVRQYLDQRVDKNGKPAKVRATREKALLSHLINSARAWGYTSAPNPCAGIRGWKAGRDRYVNQDELHLVLQHASEPVRDAIYLALLTGQRPADVRKMLRTDIRDGALWIAQNKTGKRLGIAMEGELKQVVDRCIERAKGYKVSSLHLVLDPTGQPYNEWTLRAHIRRAAETAGVQNFQLRDMRSKAATDLNDLARAQELLGHEGRDMTEAYVKNRRGKIVKPLR